MATRSGERLAAALRTALGKRQGARLFAFGTRPDSETHWFERMLTEKDPSVFSMIFATARSADPFSERAWRKANPALDEGFPDIGILRAEARVARNDPDEMAGFRALRLNQGTRDTITPFLNWIRKLWQESEVIGASRSAGKVRPGN